MTTTASIAQSPARAPSRYARQIASWVDTHRAPVSSSERIQWLRTLPLLTLHLVALVGIWFMPVSWLDVTVAIGLYLTRMFAITGFYHRYFSHKSFRTGRVHQFLWAVVGASATQRGPLWWAAIHRQHHRAADTADDPHNSRRGFWWSHIGWFLAEKHFATNLDRVRDWARFPELVWLDRFDSAVPFALAVLLFGAGELIANLAPGLTNGWQLLFWGFVVSTLVLIHVTLCINSLAHKVGTRRHDTDDDSRNSPVLALLTLGEGWHNNHHKYCGSMRQSHRRREIDITYGVLRGMERLGLIWDAKPVPQRLLEAGERS